MAHRTARSRGPRRHSGRRSRSGAPRCRWSGAIRRWTLPPRRPCRDRHRPAAADACNSFGEAMFGLTLSASSSTRTATMARPSCTVRTLPSALQCRLEPSSTPKIACCTAPLAAASRTAASSRLRASCVSCRLVARSCVPSSASSASVHRHDEQGEAALTVRRCVSWPVEHRRGHDVRPVPWIAWREVQADAHQRRKIGRSPRADPVAAWPPECQLDARYAAQQFGVGRRRRRHAAASRAEQAASAAPAGGRHRPAASPGCAGPPSRQRRSAVAVMQSSLSLLAVKGAGSRSSPGSATSIR